MLGGMTHRSAHLQPDAVSTLGLQAPDIKDEMLLAYFTSYLRPTLKPCIDRIIAIDKDPDA